jgi:hypothetical protein
MTSALRLSALLGIFNRGNKMKWKNTSSFSQSDKLRIPTTFVAEIGRLKITVTRHIHHAPTDWILICEPFFTQKVISDGTADEAKESAVIAVREKLIQALDAMTPNAK